ncbi:MAG: prolyl oligopeptidase family serine peptidase [Pseudomonadota bacterium]
MRVLAVSLQLTPIAGAGPLYAPKVAGDMPCVMILHGSEGPGSGWSHRFAAILAAHGVAALPFAYGTGDVWGAGTIHEVDITAILDAARALRATPGIATLDLFGWSRGGELAMHLGAIGGGDLPFRRIAAHAPADHCIPAFDVAEMRAGHPREAGQARAWVWPGNDVALTPGRAIDIQLFPRPVFLSVGTADEVWDHQMTLNLAKRLDAAGNPPDLFVAEGQGHAFDFETEPQLWARLLAFFTRA